MDAGRRSRLRRVLRALLRAYPKAFRDRFGRELERTYLDWFEALEDRGHRGAAARVLASATWHAVRDGLAERMTGRGGGEGTMDGIMTDMRLALRSLRKAPGFTTASVLLLALGVGANVTAYGALKVATLGRPPFPGIERLVSVDLTRRSPGRTWRSQWAYPYFDLLEQWEGRLVDPVAAYRDFHATLSGLGPASRIPIEMVSPAYFRVVGLPLALGRDFAPEEGRPGAGERVAIVSHAFWRSRLDGSGAALGREIDLNGETFRVVGVAAEGFRGLMGGAELWVPHGSYDVFQPGVLGQVGNHVAWVAGRLAPGAALEPAAGQTRVIGSVIGARWPTNDRYGADLRSFSDLWANPRARAASLLLSMAAGLVLLVACANLSGLMLARARRKVRAGAVRRALGASRWRLIRSSLLESLLVALSGCVAAVAVASWGTGVLARAWPREFLRGSETGLRVVDPGGMGLDSGSLIFAMVVSVVAALLIGALPALRASSEDVTQHLTAATGSMGGGRVSGLDTQTMLVGGQISLALMLLLSVAVLGASVAKLLGVSEGFRTERLLTFDYTLPAGVPRLDMGNAEAWVDHIELSAEFDERMKARLASLPGVEAVSITASPMLEGFNSIIGVTQVGDRPGGDGRSVGAVTVDPECFETLGFNVVSGRGFTTSDGLQGAPVVVLNRRAVDVFFEGQDPVGRRFGVGAALPGRAVAEVVGVVENVLHEDPDEVPAPVAYYSTRERRYGNHALVRTAGDPAEAVPAVRRALQELDPTVAMSGIATMDERIRRSVGDRGMLLVLLGLFGGLTVLLAAVGTWAVVSYAVADRAREVAVRVALGAQGGSVVRLVVGRVALASTLGGILGLGGGLLSTHVLRAFLFETSPWDPGLVLGGAAVLAFVVALASYLPARRATRVDPARALRALD